METARGRDQPWKSQGASVLPEWVPQMADAVELLCTGQRVSGVNYLLVPTRTWSVSRLHSMLVQPGWPYSPPPARVFHGAT